MIWPWVSRARLDLALHNLEEMRALHTGDTAFYRSALGVKDARYETLLEKYHALRASGASGAGLAPAERPSKPADQAIEDVVGRFNGNTALRRRLQKYVNTSRIAGMDEGILADSVTHWSDPDEDAA